jgi:acyl dehydratase
MPINRDAMLRYAPPDEVVSYTERDAMFYALSIGLGADPVDQSELSFVYEEGLRVFPTMALVIGWTSALNDPEFGIERGKQVVSGLTIDCCGTLQPEGRLISRTRIDDVLDAGTGALVNVRRTLSTNEGATLAAIVTSMFIRGAGNFGGPAVPSQPPFEPPAEPPHVICDLPTALNAALLYRLNGDRNPLHADPEFAQRVGFARPILHGQATFSLATHALLRSLAAYDVQRLKRVEARFVQPFYPGETLRTRAWVTGTEVVFRSWSLERDVIVLDRGRAVVNRPDEGWVQ